MIIMINNGVSKFKQSFLVTTEPIISIKRFQLLFRKYNLASRYPKNNMFRNKQILITLDNNYDMSSPVYVISMAMI